MPATYNHVLQDLSYPYQRPASMLTAAHGFAAAAHTRLLHDSIPCRRRVRRPCSSMHSSLNLRPMTATNMPELLDLSYLYCLPADMLVAAHSYVTVAQTRALYDSRPYRRRMRQPCSSMHSTQKLRSMPPPHEPELLDLSYPYRRPTGMLMAAHSYTTAAHTRALHDSRPCRRRARQPVRPPSALRGDTWRELALLA